MAWLSQAYNIITYEYEPPSAEVGGVFLLMRSTTAANYAAKSSGRTLAFPSIQLHLVTLACGSLNGQEDFKAHSY